MNAPRTSLRSRVLWRAACLFGFAGLTVLGGCGVESNEQQQPDVQCTAEAVLARNPATGQCEWASTCGTESWERCATGFECAELPAEACALDARCHVETTSVCTDCAPGSDEYPGADPAMPYPYPEPCGTCQDTTICVPNDVPPPPTGCAQLDEATCLITDGCRADYDWLYGETVPGGGDGSEVPPAPGDDDMGCTPEQCGEPTQPPPDQQWGFIGCFDDVTPSRCATIADPATCDTIGGCHWEPGYDGGMDLPCYVDPDTGETDCLAPAPVPAGYCAEGELPSSCWDLYDPNTCLGTDGCEWVDMGWDGDGGDGDCACTPDDPNCNCAGLVAPGGYCQPGTPTSCYDLYDEGSCWQHGCEWSYEGGGAPLPDPCLCSDQDPNCGCTMPEPPPSGYCHPPVMPPSCYDFYDATSCQSDPACQWTSYDGSGDRIDPCFGAWTDETGTCRAANDGLAPEYCCDNGGAAPEPWPVDGYCEPVPPPPSCYDHYDLATCQSDPACQWTSPGSSGGSDGLIDVCYNAYVGDDGVCYTEWGDPAPAECCTQTEPRPAPPPDECYLAAPGPDGACYDGFGNVAPDYCCNNGDPIDCTGAWRDQSGVCRGPADGEFPEYCCYDIGYPYCEPRQTETGCESLYDPFSCTSAGCLWADVQCDCDPADPNCACPAGFCTSP